MPQIAVLGMGAMGSRIAQNLLNAEYPVTVYNRTPDKAMSLVQQGAMFAVTPRAAAESADIVISMMTDDAASRHTWLDLETGAIAGLKQTAIAIESSTLTVSWTAELAAAIDRQGSAFVAAPIVGSRPQAEAGKLIYLAGGRAETLAAMQDILRAAGGVAIHPIGDAAQAMAMKLAVNALFGIQVAALAEIGAVLAKNGVSLTETFGCLSELPVTSPAARAAGNLILAQNHAPLFPIALVEKDFRYVVEAAQTVNAATPIAAALHSVYQKAIDRGYGSDNITGVIQLFA